MLLHEGWRIKNRTTDQLLLWINLQDQSSKDGEREVDRSEKKGKAPHMHMPNLDKRIVLAGNLVKETEGEKEDEYVFEEYEEAVQMPFKWRAIARYYSG